MKTFVVEQLQYEYQRYSDIAGRQSVRIVRFSKSIKGNDVVHCLTDGGDQFSCSLGFVLKIGATGSKTQLPNGKWEVSIDEGVTFLHAFPGKGGTAAAPMNAPRKEFDSSKTKAELSTLAQTWGISVPANATKKDVVVLLEAVGTDIAE